MAYEPPARLHLTSHRHEWWILFSAAAIAALTLAAWLSSLAFGGDDADTAGAATDWTVPLLGLGGMVAAVLLLWAAIVAVGRAHELRRVREVYARGLARWPQYATEAQWRQVIAKHARPDGSVLDVVIPAGLLTVVVGAIAVAAAVGREWTVVVVLAAFWLVLMGLVGGRRWNQERERRADRVRRERLLPYPFCVVAAEGLYDEDSGLVGLDQVTEVRVVPAAEVPQIRKRLLGQVRTGEVAVELDPFDSRLARSGWSLLQFTLDSRVARTLWKKAVDLLRSRDIGSDMARFSLLHVRIPPGCEPEAIRVVAAVQQRWLGNTRLQAR